MYIPRVNEETRLPVLHALMRAHPLAALVSVGVNGLFATHLPMVVVEDADGQGLGTLQGHISRANPQWREFVADVDALAIFAGPQHYISASWYPGKLQDGEEVPTWNYAVVHASGLLRIVEDPDWLLAHLTSLTDIHEAGSAEPWKVSDAPADFVRTQMRGIVGLELPIRKLEGKWKVSQNRNEQDRQAVVEGLERLGTADALVMKGLVERK
ncbi:MAG: FMN-binding negative transcriptional regulator [Acidobacteriaceae bacterium]|nr:FMN-binding negative transcriptional regulator [Acidobacteriaceae bacterium]